MHRSTTTHRENPNRRNSRVLDRPVNSVVTWTWLFQTLHFPRFGSALKLYVVLSTIGLLGDRRASC